MSSRPLRVAVTRDEAPDGPLTEALRRRGMQPVCCPVVAEEAAPDPEALRRAANELERYDWLVAASARAVSALMGARSNQPLPPGLRTAAVGASTAAALTAHGASAPLTAPLAGATALIEVLRPADSWPGRRVLLPRAQNGGCELGEALRGFGATTDEVVAYCTVERPPDEIASVWSAAAPDAVVVASPSAARALVRAVGAAGLRRLEPVVAIGTTTAMALVGLGVMAIVPPHADFDAVAEFLCSSRHAQEGAPR